MYASVSGLFKVSKSHQLEYSVYLMGMVELLLLKLRAGKKYSIYQFCQNDLNVGLLDLTALP
jgi:hypothetical protein